MLRKSLAALFIPLFMSGAAFAKPPDTTPSATSQEAAKLSEAFSVLHAAAQYSVTLSQMADTRAKSDLVKDYARKMAASNKDLDAKLQAVAQKNGIEVAPLDPQTEEGKSVIDRFKGETVLLGSLQGDA